MEDKKEVKEYYVKENINRDSVAVPIKSINESMPESEKELVGERVAIFLAENSHLKLTELSKKMYDSPELPYYTTSMIAAIRRGEKRRDIYNKYKIYLKEYQNKFKDEIYANRRNRIKKLSEIVDDALKENLVGETRSGDGIYKKDRGSAITALKEIAIESGDRDISEKVGENSINIHIEKIDQMNLTEMEKVLVKNGI